MHDALHNWIYGVKDAHTRNAEGQEHKGKENKSKGGGNANGKREHTCTTIAVSCMVDEHVEDTTPQPMSRHQAKIAKAGNQHSPVVLDSRFSPFYGVRVRSDEAVAWSNSE